MRKELWNWEIELNDSKKTFKLTAETMYKKSFFVSLAEKTLITLTKIKRISIGNNEKESARNIIQLFKTDAEFREKWIRELESRNVFYNLLKSILNDLHKQVPTLHLYDVKIENLDFEEAESDSIKIKVVFSGKFEE